MRNVLLVGITGTGKSSAGNLLCRGDGEFVASNGVLSCTKDGKTVVSPTNNIKVTDTMGFLDTKDSLEVTKLKITNALSQVKEGVHCVMFFVKFGRFTEVEYGAMQLMIDSIFGKEVAQHLVLVWTHVTPSKLVLEKAAQQQWIADQFKLSHGIDTSFAKTFKLCGGRVVFVSNPPHDEDAEIDKLYERQRLASLKSLLDAVNTMDENEAYLPEVARRVQREYEEKLRQMEEEMAKAVDERERVARQAAVDEFRRSAEGQKLELMKKNIDLEMASKDREIAELREMMKQMMMKPKSDDSCNIL